MFRSNEHHLDCLNLVMMKRRWVEQCFVNTENRLSQNIVRSFSLNNNLKHCRYLTLNFASLHLLANLFHSYFLFLFESWIANHRYQTVEIQLRISRIRKTNNNIQHCSFHIFLEDCWPSYFYCRSTNTMLSTDMTHITLIRGSLQPRENFDI